MPASDGLRTLQNFSLLRSQSNPLKHRPRNAPRAPPLSAAERSIVRASGAWTNFCLSYGLKPFDSGDCDHALQIVRAMVRADEEREGQERGGKGK